MMCGAGSFTLYLRGGRFAIALIIASIVALVGSVSVADESATLDVYLNADLTHAHSVGDGLLLGLQAGLAVGGDRYAGPDVALHIRDHRNNMRRTGALIEEARGNPSTLAIIGGMHTPHYLRHGEAINAAQLVLMLPWSAGATLTRMTEGADNHIFRLSVDDRKVAPFLARQSARLGCRRVATLALDNGWGKQNAKGLARELPLSDVAVANQYFLRGDSGSETTALQTKRMMEDAPDCVIFVLDARTSAFAANALSTWETPPRVLSHWGILGGSFVDHAKPSVWTRLDLALLTTCVLDLSGARAQQMSQAIAAAAAFRPHVRGINDLPLRIAFSHAFDVGLVLRAAAVQAQSDPLWTQGREGRSTSLRNALEALDIPVEGILKRYERPFSVFSRLSQDGHEALSEQDLCLAVPRPDGTLAASSW